MRTTIDGAGRLVIPKALRDRIGLAAGTEVEIDERDGVIEIQPTPRSGARVKDRRHRGVALGAVTRVRA